MRLVATLDDGLRQVGCVVVLVGLRTVCISAPPLGDINPVKLPKLRANLLLVYLLTILSAGGDVNRARCLASTICVYRSKL